jgi:hypothetical protein
VIDMSRVGASGASTYVGGIHGSWNFNSGPGTRHFITGIIDSDCIPLAITTRSIPEPIPAAALSIAVRLPAQSRFTDWPGTSSMRTPRPRSGRDCHRHNGIR